MDVQEFVPQSYNTPHLVSSAVHPLPETLKEVVIRTWRPPDMLHLMTEPVQANGSESSSYEHFTNPPNPIPAQNHLNSQTPLYQDTLSMGGASFFPSQSGFQQPVSTYRMDTA